MNVLEQVISTDLLSYTSLEAVVGPTHIQGITQVSYEHRIEQGELRGTGPFVLGTTRGNYQANGSMTIYIEAMADLRRRLAALPGPGVGYMEKKFLILYTYAEPLSGKTLVDRLEDCRIISERSNHSQSPDPLLCECDIFIRRIVKAGVPAVGPL